MAELTVGEVVKEWSENDSTLFSFCTDAPKFAWLAILEILQRELTSEQIALLAAGPLETLLSWHGSAFIDRVEQQAQRDERFSHLLGGVWQRGMPPEVWERVQAARKQV